jgi:hypothetical protein
MSTEIETDPPAARTRRAERRERTAALSPVPELHVAGPQPVLESTSPPD